VIVELLKSVEDTIEDTEDETAEDVVEAGTSGVVLELLDSAREEEDVEAGTSEVVMELEVSDDILEELGSVDDAKEDAEDDSTKDVVEDGCSDVVLEETLDSDEASEELDTDSDVVLSTAELEEIETSELVIELETIVVNDEETSVEEKLSELED
jgi:hypothetical protein